MVQSSSANTALISNVFIDTDLRQAIQDIAAQADTIIVLGENVEGLVTCDLRNVTLEKALEIVLAGSNYIIKKKQGYYLVCSLNPKNSLFSEISETRLVKMNYITPEYAVKLLSKSFKEYVAAGDNIISITAPPALIERILSDLELFDTPPLHVLLIARIVVLERTNMRDVGIKWGWPSINIGAFADSAQHNSNWPWGIQIGYTPDREFTNSLLMKLNLLSQKGEAKVIAGPQVLAQNNKEAEIKVLTEEYFKIVTEGYYTKSELEKIETGTVLTITPKIAENGYMALVINAEVSDVVSRGEDNLPVVTRRTVKSTVGIEDGGTVAIAGLMDDRTRLDKHRTPGLSDIPLIGPLFSNKNNQKVSRQVAIFVTAQLIQQSKMQSSISKKLLQPNASVSDDLCNALEESLLGLK